MRAWLAIAACTSGGDDAPAVDLTVTITSPGDAEQVEVGERVTLAAVAVGPDGAPVDAGIDWTSSLEGAIAVGSTTQWFPTEPGPHVITAAATDGDDAGEATITLWVRDAPPDLADVTLFDALDGVPEATWYGLSIDADGTVWAASSAGLIAIRGDVVRLYGTADGLAVADVRAALRHPDDGDLWVGYALAPDRDGDRFAVADDGTLTGQGEIDFDSTGEVREVHHIAVQPYGDGEGDVWFGTNEGLCVYDRALDVFAEHLHPTHPHDDTLSIAFSPDGHVWNGDKYQLSRWAYDHDGTLSSTANLVTSDRLWTDDEVAVDIVGLAGVDAAVWVASRTHGVVRVDAGVSEITPTPLDPATVPSALSIAAGSGGAVWIGTPTGLYRTDDGGALEAIGGTWMPGPEIHAIAASPDDGTVWLATDEGLVRYVAD